MLAVTSLRNPHRERGALLLVTRSTMAAGTADAADQQDTPHVTIGEAGVSIQSVP
jgi:hypothetical protein